MPRDLSHMVKNDEDVDLEEEITIDFNCLPKDVIMTELYNAGMRAGILNKTALA